MECCESGGLLSNRNVRSRPQMSPGMAEKGGDGNEEEMEEERKVREGEEEQAEKRERLMLSGES